MQLRESLYDLLQVDSNASASDVRRSFLRLAFEYHPDIASDTDSSDERFKKVRAAYEILIDPQLRSLYDLDPESIHHRFGRSSPIVTEPSANYDRPSGGRGEFRPVWLKDTQRKTDRVLFWGCVCAAAGILVSSFFYTNRVYRANHAMVTAHAASNQSERTDAPTRDPVAPSERPQLALALQRSSDAKQTTGLIPNSESPSEPNQSTNSDEPSFDWHYMPLESVKASLPMFPEDISATPNREAEGGWRTRSADDARRYGSVDNSQEPLMSMTAGLGVNHIINRADPANRYRDKLSDRPWQSRSPIWHSSAPGMFGQAPSQAELVGRSSGSSFSANTGSKAGPSIESPPRGFDRFRAGLSASINPRAGYGGYSVGIAPVTTPTVRTSILGNSPYRASIVSPRRMPYSR